MTNGTRLAFPPFPSGHQPAGAFLSLRGTSRKTKLIEIHENFIRNSEASVKPGVALHIKQFSLVFFPRVDVTHADPLSMCVRRFYRVLDIFHTMVYEQIRSPSL